MDTDLTHYTTNPDVISKILENGLAWVPNKRGLISRFIKHHDFSEREPQEFGMISFTELPINNAEEHRGTFGDYGIVMAPEWVKANNPQKVIYIEERGPLQEAMAAIFNIGYFDLKSKIKHPDDGAMKMAYTNKNMASITGANLWVNLLQLYEYLEPICNSYQQEWRIIHDGPLYGYKKTKARIIENVSPPKNWATVVNALKIEPNDVAGFICPKGYELSLIERLPVAYREHSIDTYEVL